MPKTPATDWFVKDERGQLGPLSELELRRVINESSDRELMVREGETGEWHSVDVICEKLAELVANGIYIRFDGVTEGPFTVTKAYELLQSIDLKGIELRIGKAEQWVKAKRWFKVVRELDEELRRLADAMSPRDSGEELGVDDDGELDLAPE